MNLWRMLPVLVPTVWVGGVVDPLNTRKGLIWPSLPAQRDFVWEKLEVGLKSTNTRSTVLRLRLVTHQSELHQQQLWLYKVFKSSRRCLAGVLLWWQNGGRESWGKAWKTGTAESIPVKHEPGGGLELKQRSQTWQLQQSGALRFSPGSHEDSAAEKIVFQIICILSVTVKTYAHHRLFRAEGFRQIWGLQQQ